MSELENVASMLAATAQRIDAKTTEQVGELRAVAQRSFVAGCALESAPERAVTLEEVGIIVSRLRAALQRGSFDGIRNRDLRVGVRAFERFSPREVAQLLEYQPGLWTRFVRQFFAVRHALSVENEAAWLSVVRSSPATEPLLSGTLPVAALLRENPIHSAIALSAAIPAQTPLAMALKGLTAPGLLDPRWPYTALVLGACAMSAGRSASASWAAVEQSAELEAMLLPAREPAGASWFGRGRIVPKLGSSVAAQAMFVVALLRQQMRGGLTVANELWQSALFDSAFRDPREFADPRERPESPGWIAVKSLAEVEYDAFISSLFAEDVSLFFNAIDIDPARRDFWRRYVGSARSSLFMLSAATRERLDRRFSGSDTRVRGVLRRARQLTQSGGVDAFAMRFNQHAVVEFSQTGNASYMYENAVFDAIVGGRGSMQARELRRPELGGTRLLHTSGWQADFAALLRSVGVAPK